MCVMALTAHTGATVIGSANVSNHAISLGLVSHHVCSVKSYWLKLSTRPTRFSMAEHVALEMQLPVGLSHACFLGLACLRNKKPLIQ